MWGPVRLCGPLAVCVVPGYRVPHAVYVRPLAVSVGPLPCAWQAVPATWYVREEPGMRRLLQSGAAPGRAATRGLCFRRYLNTAAITRNHRSTDILAQKRIQISLHEKQQCQNKVP